MPGTKANPTPWDPEEPLHMKWNEEDHGKYTTYNRGCRCDLCKRANTERLRKYRSSSPGKQYKDEQAARQRAYTKLANRYPDEFNLILRQELIDAAKTEAEESGN